jgi:hypothetical protein
VNPQPTPTEEIQRLARHLVARAADRSEGDPRAGAERVIAQLESPLARLVGHSSFRLLLGRAVQRAGQRVPLPEDIAQRDGTGGARDVFTAATAGQTPEQVAAAAEAVVAELISLLIRFLGRGLTLRLLLGSIPDLPPEIAEPFFRTTRDE